MQKTHGRRFCGAYGKRHHKKRRLLPEVRTQSGNSSDRAGGQADGLFETVVHTVKMESLQDAFSDEELFDFEPLIEQAVENTVFEVIR